MKRIVKALATVLSAALAFATVSFASEAGVPAVEALDMLKEGNAQFLAGDVEHLVAYATAERRFDTGTNGQHPYAIVVTCADSRLSPEILFNKGIGEVFVVRVAGNVIAPHELGSIEYAAEHLGARLIVVLGHTKCGAVNAAYGYYSTPEELRPELSNNLLSIVESVKSAVEKSIKHGQTAAEAVEYNVDDVVKEIKRKSEVIREMMDLDGVQVVGASYDVVTGSINWHSHKNP
jgi:carbonic anhydrase